MKLEIEVECLYREKSFSEFPGKKKLMFTVNLPNSMPIDNALENIKRQTLIRLEETITESQTLEYPRIMLII